MKVLVIEDDAKSRRYLVDAVTSAGHEVIEAADGDIGLHYYRELQPDLVLCDIQMPGIDGLEVLVKLRQQDDTVAVVMMTAFGSEDYAIKALRDGANDYLKKPVRVKDLSAILEKYASLSTDTATVEALRTKNRLLDINLALKKELKNQAELLIQYEKMSSIGTLTTSIAHEISNSMLSVIGNLSFLSNNKGYVHKLMSKYNAIEKIISQHGDRETVVGKIEEVMHEGQLAETLAEVRKFVDDAMDGANQVDSFLNDLKGLSRTGDGKHDLINLNEQLKIVIKMMRTRLKHKVTINMDYSDLPPVSCSPQKIGQVFMNLLLNAEQAIEDRGTISIITRSTPSANNQHTPPWAEVIIADTGEGIAPENLPLIFTPFFTTKPKGEGTGLGMKISNDIITDHGGTISVESKVGKGTRVTVRLPLSSPLEGINQARLSDSGQ